MKKVLVVLMLMAVAAIVASAVTAAPSLPITKPPLGPVPSYTGPVQDPHAIQGQWFKDMGTSAEAARCYEFHDNVTSHGGGSSSFNAIYGKVNSLTLVSGKITAFTIQATITNDVPALSPWIEGTNSHGEYVEQPREQYVGPLLQTKLTTSFAISGLGNLPASWTAPYRDRQPYITAQGFDELAWYCWTPGNPDPEKQPYGGYYVPTYDFGDIGIGQSVTRNLSFIVDGAGIDSSDPRYTATMESYTAAEGQGDIFLNRTTSLKISDWIDELTLDTGIPYPTDPLKGSDVSVFHCVPEPGSLLALGGGLLSLAGMALRRRR